MTSYKPDCTGHYYQYPFDCLGLTNGFDLTTCTTYSDQNCQNVLNGTLRAPVANGKTFQGEIKPPVFTPGRTVNEVPLRLLALILD
jgi:hypothetical protein